MGWGVNGEQLKVRTTAITCCLHAERPYELELCLRAVHFKKYRK